MTAASSLAFTISS